LRVFSVAHGGLSGQEWEGVVQRFVQLSIDLVPSQKYSLRPVAGNSGFSNPSLLKRESPMASHLEHESLRHQKLIDRTRNEIQKSMLLREHQRMLLESSAQLLQEHKGLRIKSEILRAKMETNRSKEFRVAASPKSGW
jgi:hypothetical protein